MKIMWTVKRLDCDHTLKRLDEKEWITKNTWTKYFPQWEKISSNKCDTNDTLCNNCDDTHGTILKTLEMRVTRVYMVRKHHLCKYYPLKPPKLAFIFLQMGEKNFEKTHVTSLNVCDKNIQDQGRLRNFVVGKHFGGCCSSDNTRLKSVMKHF